MSIEVKPTEKPNFATGGSAAVTTPSGAKKLLGWINEKPPHQFFNWLHRFTSLWVDYFESITDRIKLDTFRFTGITANATPVTIATILLTTNSSMIIKAFGSGLKNTVNTLAEFIFQARRDAGAPTVENLSSYIDGADNVSFSLVPSGNNLLLQVTAEAGPNDWDLNGQYNLEIDQEPTIT